MSHLQDVFNAPEEEVSALIKEKVKDSEKVQEDTLMDILEISADTEFGKKHNFKDIKSIQDFRDNVPIVEYDYYLDDIERIKNGEENILFPEKPVQFILTSGTTDVPKFIPHTKLSKRLLDQVTLDRTKVIGEYIPETVTSHSFVITNFSQILKTAGSVSAGSASGIAGKLQANNPNMVPPSVLTSTGTEDVRRVDEIDYISILFGARDKTIKGFAGNDSSYLSYLFNILNNNIDKILNDIRNGTISVEISDTLRERITELLPPDPERADELEKIYKEKGELKVEDVWPDFFYVVGWLSSSMGRLLQEHRDTFPEETIFYDAGFGASEGKFNIPIKPNSKTGLPVVYGFFFEFLPIGSDEPVLLQETNEEELYELIITTYSGFYRYNMKDLVRITKDEDGLYQMEFIGKTKDKADIGDVTIYGADIINMIEEYEGTTR